MSKDPTKAELIDAVALEIRAQQNDVDEFDDAACERLGIGRTDLRCMDILARNQPMTAGQLATASGVSTGAVTAVLDRMERAGYVSRRRDEVDRRRVIVEVTPKTWRDSEGIWAPVSADFTELLSRYTKSELKLILGFARRSREINRRHLERLKGDARGMRTPGRRIWPHSPED